jgi:hypothetical protein
MNLYFFSDHPFDLVMYAGLQTAIRVTQPNIRATLIQLHHPYIDKCEAHRFHGFFDEVHKLDYCHYRTNVFKGIPQALRFKESFDRVPIKPDGTVFFSSASQLVSNIAVSSLRRRGIKTVLLRQVDGFATDQVDYKSQFRFSFWETFRVNVYSVLLSLHRLNVYQNRSSRIIFSRTYRNFPFQHAFTLKNPAYETLRNKDDIYFPFYFDKEQTQRITQASTHSVLMQPLVIFFGSRFLGWDYGDASTIVQRVNQFLRAIATAYPLCALIYKPHPLEGEEKKVLDLQGYHVIDDLLTAEMLFAMYPNVKAVYSIGSTSCKTAAAFGLNSYVLYDTLNLPPAVVATYNGIFEGFPTANRISQLDEISRHASPDSLHVERKKKQLINKITASVNSLMKQSAL